MTANESTVARASLLVPETVGDRFRMQDDRLEIRPQDPDDPVMIAGDLEAASIPEVLTIINSSRHTGELILQYDVARKALYFIEGEIAAVQSNVAEDRIGEIMWRQGLISLDQLAIAVAQLEPHKRIGRLLIDNGFIDTRQLYEGLRAQVRDVFLSIFHVQGGSFCFVGELLPEVTLLRLEERTDTLIVEGIRHFEELRQLREYVGDLSTELMAVPASESRTPDEAEQAAHQLLSSAKRPLSIETIVQKSGLGEYRGLRAVVGLIEGGLARPANPADRAALEASARPQQIDPLFPALDALTFILGVLREECGGADTWVRMFLEEREVCGQQLFREIPVNDQGKADGTALKARALALGPRCEKELRRAVKEAIDFASFQIGDLVGEARSQEVSDRIAEILGPIS